VVDNLQQEVIADEQIVDESVQECEVIADELMVKELECEVIADDRVYSDDELVVDELEQEVIVDVPVVNKLVQECEVMPEDPVVGEMECEAICDKMVVGEVVTDRTVVGEVVADQPVDGEVDGEVVADQPVVPDLVNDEPDIMIRVPMVRRVPVEEEREVYQNYTICPLHAPRLNEKATDLYQMLKVEEPPMDSRAKSLGMMCFPDWWTA